MNARIFASNLNSTKSELKSAVKKFDGSNPSLATVAGFVESMRTAFVKMENFSEALTPSFQSAKNNIDAAWDNRDNTIKMVEYIKAAFENLEKMDEETAAEKVDTIGDRTSMKALYGETVAAIHTEPFVVNDTKQVVTALKSFVIANSINRKDINRVKSIVSELSEHFRNVPTVAIPLQETEQLLTQASNDIYAGRIESGKSVIKSGLATFGKAQNAIHEYTNPVGHKNTLSETGINSIKTNINDIRVKMAKIRFSSPRDMIVEVAKSTKAIKTLMAQFHEPRANRFVVAAYDALDSAFNYVNTGAQKSFVNTWENEDMQKAFDYAISQIDELETYLNGIR